MAFTKMLRSSTQLKKVKLVTERDYSSDAEEAAKHEMFLQEIHFYTKNKQAEIRKEEEYQAVLAGCEPDAIFKTMLANIEKKSENHKMPVRKFFDNTFGNLLNDALFDLKKKQLRQANNDALFTKEGMIKEVGLYIAAHLPEAETQAAGEREESEDEQK
jgi:hypothetical protein